MKLHGSCLLMFFLHGSVIVADRRRVSFKTCISSKSEDGMIPIMAARSRTECSVLCLNDPGCLSASYCKTPGGHTCQLSDHYSDGDCSGFVSNAECTVTTLVNPCDNGGMFFPGNKTCHCVDGFVGDYCQRRYRDCLETPGQPGIGRYLIQPWGSTDIYEPPCSSHLTSVTQLLESVNPDFSKPWQEMRDGFPGKIFSSFLGLEPLHRLTNQGVYDMNLFLRGPHDIASAVVVYKNVRVDSEDEGYALHWDSFHNDPSDDHLGSDLYVDGFGGVGDSTKNLNGARFGTTDRDVSDCVRVYSASWWYNPAGCAAFGLDPLSWPTNRSGTVVLEKINVFFLWLVPRQWYIEDDLVL